MDSSRNSWSFPFGRIFGIQLRIHILFLALIVVDLVKAGRYGAGVVRYVAIYLGLLFGSVLLHELGHCFAARRVGGRAESIILWPLGGLARVDLPRTWWANFWCSFGGPVVNVAIALVCFGVMAYRRQTIDLDPMQDIGLDWVRNLALLNERLFLFNILPIFPLDGGGMAQALLWRRMGYAAGTLVTIRVAKVALVLMGIYGLYYDQTMLILLALYCYYAAEQERVALEMGAAEEGFMGYDFSNGYTSLEASSPRPARRTSFAKRISRWFSSRRAEKQARREKDEEDELKARVDSLLEKIGREGMAALSTEERDFLNEASKHYRM